MLSAPRGFPSVVRIIRESPAPHSPHGQGINIPAAISLSRVTPQGQSCSSHIWHCLSSRFYTCGHGQGTVRSGHGTVRAQYGQGTARPGHSTVRAWHGQDTVRLRHGTARTQYRHAHKTFARMDFGTKAQWRPLDQLLTAMWLSLECELVS
jgi:hypothetical protein